MKIKLSPIASSWTTKVSVQGDIVTVDATGFDLSALPDNSVCDAEYPAVGQVSRTNGVIELTLIYHYDSAKAEPQQSTDMADYQFDIETGDVPCPITWLPVTTNEESADAEPIND